MEKLVYVYYVILLGLFLWGCKLSKRSEWNEEFMSLKQTKALQGFTAICILFHHVGQKTCASWLNPRYIRPGLELFVPIGYFFVGIFIFCSGYGLYKSYREKENYFKGYFQRRVLPLVLAFYSTGILFFIVRVLMKEKMKWPKAFYYLSGLKLANPNAWYVIVMPFFYAAFYFAYKYCKNENVALIVLVAVTVLYQYAGTVIDHNDWWMRGEWWYNSIHFFVLGILFARFEKKIIPHLKKHYLLYLILAVVLTYVLFELSEVAQAVFSYYGEDFHAEDKVFRRWMCLLSQEGASIAFVTSVFLLNLKLKIGNPVLDFMGKITLEFYLIHGLYVELFGFNFMDAFRSIHYIKNVALYTLVVIVLALPSAILLQKLHQMILRKKS